MPQVTPLLRFLRALTGEQREAFAAACGTTVGYLYQLAAQPEPNPRLRLAFALAAESRRIHRKVHAGPLTLPDLIVGPVFTEPRRRATRLREARQAFYDFIGEENPPVGQTE